MNNRENVGGREFKVLFEMIMHVYWMIDKEAEKNYHLKMRL